MSEIKAWQEATECETPDQADKHITQLYKWLTAWQDWAREILEHEGLQLKGGHYGDTEARNILRRRLIGEE